MVKKALINDYFNDKTILLMLPKLQPTPKKRQNNLILVVKRKTHDQKHK
ncbi:hypothetical protein MNU24_01205 [Spiroplasma poulsonii]|nr:hypothetical protein [Spiroplasma poulsonii]UNF62110.1 hypothetical protein MNU24_01205 [Spiroplasma poulsonii]